MQLNTKFFDTWPWPKGTLSMEWRSLILCSPCTFLKHFKGQVACCTFLENHWTCSGITSIVNLCSSGTNRRCFPSEGKLLGTGALDVISWSAWTDSVEPLNGSERQKRESQVLPSLSLLCFQLLKRKVFLRAARNTVPWLSSKHPVSKLLVGNTSGLFACPYILYLLP